MGTDAGGSRDAATRLGAEVVDRTPDTVEIRVTGEIDLVTAPVLRFRIERWREDAGRVVLDLGEVAYCDSTGLVLLLELTREAEEAGWTLLLRRRLGPPVARLLEVTRTETLLLWLG